MDKKELEKLIKSDLIRYGFGEKLTFREKMRLEGYLYTSALRKAKYYKEKNNLLLFIFHRIIIKRMSYKYGYQITYSTKFGKGLYLGHFGHVVVNGDAVLGDNINLSPGVTIGMTNRGKTKGVPVLGNNIWVGTNAVIVGGIHIGNDVMIAPNSLVNLDVPDHSIVIGNPMVIHHRDNATEFYVEHTT